MQKVFQFTPEQKSLIWRTKVEPMNGTGDDAHVFIEICETYGLNPLLGDIVFQRYETKFGPAVNHITTRDGYLKVAMRDSNYVRTMSAVVKEGDHFQFDVVNGSVEHRFGAKRGNILGAWAVCEHKERGRLAAFVDFDEYFRANAKSQNGRSPIWDSMPSAMITKVAEVFVLRRQFPLGLVTEEEMGTSGFDNFETITAPTTTPEAEESTPSQSASMQPKEEKKKPTNKKNQKKEKNEEVQPSVAVNEEKGKQEMPKETVSEKTQPVQSEPVNQPKQTSDPEKSIPTEPTEKVEESTTAKETSVAEITQETSSDMPIWTIELMETGKTGKGIVFGKLQVCLENKRILVLAQGEEKVKLLDGLQNGDKVQMTYISENNFNFLQSISKAN